MPSGKSLSPDENKKLQVAVAQLLEKYGTQSALAKALGVKQQMISHVHAGGNAGVYFANKVAALSGYKSYTDMIGAAAIPRYGDSESWKQNEPEARRQMPLPAAAYRLARDTPAYIGLATYTPAAIAATTMWRWALASDDEKAEAEARQIKSEINSVADAPKSQPPPRLPHPKPLLLPVKRRSRPGSHQ